MSHEPLEKQDTLVSRSRSSSPGKTSVLHDGHAELGFNKKLVDQEIALEEGHEIQYRTCSWQKVTSSKNILAKRLLMQVIVDSSTHFL
jgi:hypothetical protein